MSTLRPFHLAVLVRNIEEARHFYGTILGCKEGRSDTTWVDFNLFGHQFVTHHKPVKKGESTSNLHYNPVDGHGVPVPHFGVVLSIGEWEELAEKVKSYGIEFVIEPYTRFKGEVGEQSTMFFLDPSGNALEFKAFADMNQIFAK